MGLLKIASYLLIFLASACSGCPPASEISPRCTCNVYADDSIMSCSDLFCFEDLVTPISAVSRHNSKIFSLTIYNSSLMFIPRRAFKNTGIELLRLVRTELMAFSDDDTAFEGLEDTLTEFRSIEAEYVAQWDWKHLRKLKVLSLIDVHSMVLETIDEPFPHLPALTALGIIRAKISYIVDKAFSDLPKLTVFNMQENDITEVKRSMFPDPANNLAIIDLSYNKLCELPEDFFSNMPRLQDVHLIHNNFQTIHEMPFSVAFKSVHLISLIGNPIRCDCRIRWLTDSRLPFTFNANCASPEVLKDKPIKDLEYKSLWCYT